ncbi:hypothetical protein M0D69_35635 [Caballeronia sp. SEWSISQ10-4 2]|uniref:hypothetical protein n=1 Tax=Caballeronia sp. SEWSISQ10-4 2 TaxID=2937438 RepID=UPI00264DD1A5|nr:hypothetical protein [Caballeronia sp. SEWSISQ10-4 2]MDN7183256.1 hypothetical protein [Caballeronia sp. SEWSISQ10-4 2]
MKLLPEGLLRAIRVRPSLLLAAGLSAAVLVAGCSWFGPTRTALHEVTVVAQSGANNKSATRVDVVFIYDTVSAAALPRTGPDWFNHRDDLRIAMGSKIDVASVQLPANQVVAPVTMPQRYEKALVVYCYVNFVAAAGQGVADLTQFERVRITLSPNTVTYDGTR